MLEIKESVFWDTQSKKKCHWACLIEEIFVKLLSNVLYRILFSPNQIECHVFVKKDVLTLL